MMEDLFQKIRSDHLRRNAFLYIRQSTMRQTIEHQESTRRQYALKKRAIALGWPSENVVVIDDDLGQTAALSGRHGFKKLVSEVGMGNAGIVMSIEASRLARNSTEWHRLVEICALTKTLILDEDGIYDPAHFNDRLLLGMKGTMSEVELHLMRNRLIGGLINKAKRGELRMRLPIGFIYDQKDRVILDPDKQVQECIHLFFKTFRRLGSIQQTVNEFYKKGIKFPKRMHHGPCKGELVWSNLIQSRASYILHNPRYAGVYAFGRRTHYRTSIDGNYIPKWVERKDWTAFIKDAHEGYITWEEFERNQKVLETNNINNRAENSPPREGSALLQGLVMCGLCGKKMTIRYKKWKDNSYSIYQCSGKDANLCGPLCQSIPGRKIDEEIGRLLIDTMSPAVLEISIAVQEELKNRIQEADNLRHKEIERIQYEVDLARQRYMNVDPSNRLVADSLETEWNAKLREHAEAKERYEQKRKKDRLVLNDEVKAEILNLASDFPKLWKDPRIGHRERKRMIRLLIEDVTLTREDEITLHIRFKGGSQKTIKLPRPKSACEEWVLEPKIVEEIDRLLNHHTNSEIAKILNNKGLVSGQGKSFDGRRIGKIQRAYKLEKRYDRLRKIGLLTAKELGAKIGITASGVRERRRKGKLKGITVNDSGQQLYQLEAIF